MEVKIRKVGVEDSRLVFQITREAFQNYLDPLFFTTVPALQERISDVENDIESKNVLLAYLDEIPVGTVRFYSLDGDRFFLTRLGVLKEYQGYNIGVCLLNEVEKRVKKLGGEMIVLYSAWRLKKLLRFYQGFNYDIEEILDGEEYKRAKLVKIL